MKTVTEVFPCVLSVNRYLTIWVNLDFYGRESFHFVVLIGNYLPSFDLGKNGVTFGTLFLPKSMGARLLSYFVR